MQRGFKSGKGLEQKGKGKGRGKRCDMDLDRGWA